MALPKKLVHSGIIIVLATVLSRSLGFVRELVNAYSFGISRMMDAYNIADTFPHLINIVLIEGIISTVYIPVFTDVLKKKGKKEFWKLFSNLFFLSLLFSVIISIFLIIFGAPIAHSLFPGMFVGKVHVAMILWKMLSVLIIFRVIMCLFMAALNSLEHFFVPAISPAILNGVIILFLLFFPSHNIYKLAWGIIAGTILQCILYIPVLRKHGMHISWYLNYKDRTIQHIFKMILPVCICLLIGNINFLVLVKSYASSISGAVSAFSYAFKFVQLPVSVFAIALSIVSFPYVNFIKDNAEKFNETLTLFCELIGIIIFPIITFLIVLSYPIVKLVFFRGMFDLRAIEMTSSIVRVFSLSIIPLSFLPFLIKIYYAKGKMRIPIITAASCVVLNTILYSISVPIDQWKWIAAGYVISLFVNLTLLVYCLRTFCCFTLNIWNLFIKIAVVCSLLGAGLRIGYIKMQFMNISETTSVISSLLIFISLYVTAGYFLNFPFINKLQLNNN